MSATVYPIRAEAATSIDLALAACRQRAARHGITAVEAATDLMGHASDSRHYASLAAYAAAHAQLVAEGTISCSGGAR